MADPLADSVASLCGALCGLRDQVQALATVHAAIDEFNGVFGAFQNAMALHASCLAFPAPPKPVPPPPPTRMSTGIPKPQIATNIPAANARASTSSGSGGRPSDAAGAPPAPSKGPAGGKKRPSGGPPPAGQGPAKKKPPTGKRPPPKSRAAAAAAAQKNARPETAPWKWDKNVRDAIPRKYQSEAELGKLENILIYLKNRHGGVYATNPLLFMMEQTFTNTVLRYSTIADLVKHSGLAVIRCKEILQTLTKINLIGRKQEKGGFLYTFGPSDE